MSEQTLHSRRRVLATGLSGAMMGLAGCSADAFVTDGSRGENVAQSDESPPVVDNSAPDESRNVEIAVTVVDKSGEQVSNVRVKLEDRGGTPDDRYGTTDASGQVRFLESVGPPPCNWLTIRLPEYGVADRLGCFNGKTSVRRTYQIEQGESESPPAVDYPVVDNSASDPERNVTLDVVVLQESGESASNVEVELEDRGGTPDDRYGTTGDRGRLRFIESVGPPPCNRLTLRLPETGQTKRVGCYNGGTVLEEKLVRRESEAYEPPEDVDYPVVSNPGSSADRTITVDLTVVDDDGEPLSGDSVKLEDRGGTPDDRFGETGPRGRIRFIENVGPPPCNTQTVRLPERGQSFSLGCNNGRVTVERTLTVSRDRV